MTLWTQKWNTVTDQRLFRFRSSQYALANAKSDLSFPELFVEAAMDRESGRKCGREIAHERTGFRNPCPIRFTTSAQTPNPT